MRKPGEPLPVETLPRDELEKLQNKRLKYTLRQAYEHTLFWHEKFDSLGIRPEDIKNKEDLLKAYKKGLEVTAKDFIERHTDLLPDYLSELYCQPLWSSSLGASKKIYYTSDDFKRSNEQVCEVLNAMRIKKGDRVLSMLAPPPFSSGILSREGFKEYGVHLQEIMVSIPSPQLATILRWYKPNFLIGLASRLFQLARDFEENSISPADFEIKSIGISGESASKEMKNTLEKKWGSEIFDVWGTTEASTLGFECNFHNGMHVTESRVLVEIVNPETKEILSEDEEGNDLITLLYDEGEKPGTFIINYSLGDITKKISTNRCECGRTLIKVDYPKRIDETMNIEGRKIWAKSVEKAIVSTEKLTGEYIVLKYIDKATKQIRGYEVKVQTRKNLSLNPQERKKLETRVLNSFIEANPPAYESIIQWNKSNKIVISPLEYEMYEEFKLKLPPGKPRKLITKEV